MSPFRFIATLLILGAVVAQVGAVSPADADTFIAVSQPVSQTYVFDVDWTGSSSARLDLGTCSYPLTATVEDGRNLASQTVSETDLLNTCGFIKTIDSVNINIEGSVQFFELAATGDRKTFDATAYIVYPLVARANSETTISLLQSDDVGVDVVIPSALTLRGETILEADDPRLTTTVGSSLCFRHTITSTSQSQLFLFSVGVALAGNPLNTGDITEVVDSIGASGWVEYCVKLTTGPCLTCQYTSTLILTDSNPSTSARRLLAAIGSVSPKTRAVTGTAVTVKEESDSESHILSWYELEIIAITALVAGVSFLILLVSIIYHHVGLNHNGPAVARV